MSDDHDQQDDRHGEGPPLSPLFDGDTGALPEQIRNTLVSLMKRRYISSDTHPREWQIICDNEPALRTRLHDMYLDLIVDRAYQVAFKRQVTAETGTKYPTLLHDLAYSREETILLVTLRMMLRSNSGQDAVFVDRAELLDEVANYRPEGATDRVRDEQATAKAIQNLINADLLLKTEQDDRFRIAAVIEVLLPLRKLKQVLAWLNDDDAAELVDEADAPAMPVASSGRTAVGHEDDLLTLITDPSDEAGEIEDLIDDEPADFEETA
jgi:hypothetical protein